MTLLEVALACILALWCGAGVVAAWNFWGATVLRPEQATEPLSERPKVSIIVAGRNEERTLPAALESFLSLDYSNYEVILVDDDSTDRTGAIADEWARRPEAHGRLRVIHNHELPRGWTGKVYALSLASRAAEGEWILATDADVVFHPALLRLALDCAQRRGVALLSLAPEFELGSFADKVVLPLFSLLLTTLYPLRLVNNSKSPRAMAAGAFILMRRRDLEQLGGYERLRQTVIEDVRTAEMFKRKGLRIYLAATRGLFRTRTYRTWRQLWEALSRSAFEGSGYSVTKVLFGAVVGNIITLLPDLTLVARLLRDALGGQPLSSDLALLLALGAVLMRTLVYLPFLLYFRASPLYALTLPLASAFYSAVSINSAWESSFGDGVAWKGRNYRAP